MTSPYLPTFIDTGLITVTAGQKAFTGAGTFWDGAVWDGDMLFLPSQPLVPPQRVKIISGNGNGELAYNWPGASAAGVAYEMRLVGMVERSTVQSRRVIEQLRTVAAHGRGLFMYFDDATAAGDPGPGKVRLNAAPGAATAAYIDILDAEGASIAGLLDLWDGSNSTSRGWLELRSLARPTNAFIYELTGAIAAPSGYRIPPLALLDGTGSFEAGEALMMSLARTGDQGDSFTSDATAANLAARAAYDAQPAGFTVLVADDGATPPRSRFDRRVGSAGTWVTIGYLTGSQGIQGPQGDKGWSPQLVTVADGNRRVQKLLGYVGGAGVAPTANVGQYLKGDGTFTATIGDAVDIRGQAGLGTVAGVVAGTGITVVTTDPTLPVVKLADVATATIKGRKTAGAGAPEDLTADDARLLLRQPLMQIGDTIDSTNVASITLTGLDDFRILELSGLLRPVAADQVLYVRFSTDGGSTWITSGYARLVQTVISSAGDSKENDSQGGVLLNTVAGVPSTQDLFLDYFRVLNFNRNEWARYAWQTHFFNAGVSAEYFSRGSGRESGTAARNAMQIFASSGGISARGLVLKGSKG